MSVANSQSIEGTVSSAALIARVEINANLRSLRLLAALGAMTLLFLVSAHLSASDYRQRFDNWNINQAARHDPIISAAVTYDLPDGSFLYHAGTAPEPPVQRPQPMSALIKGLDAEADRAVTLGQRIGFGPRQDDSVSSTLFDSPDMAFVVKIVGSLLAVFLSLGAVTRDKETGTLGALLSYELRRRDLLVGKAAGACVSLFVPYTVGYFSSIAYLYSIQGVPRGREELMRALLIFFLGLLYCLVFISLGLFISTITTRTKSAVITALLAWAAIVLVMPNVLVLAANGFSPSPSYNQVNARLYEAQQRIIQEELRAHPEAKSIFDTPNARQAVYRTIDMDKQLTDDYIARKQSEVDRAQRLGVISPAGALTFGSSELASTGAGAYGLFLEFLRSGRDTIIDALKRRWDLPPDQAARLMQITTEDVTSRQRPTEPLRVSMRSAVSATVSLVAWALLFGLAACWQFGRYDVR